MIAALLLVASLGASDQIFANGFEPPCGDPPYAVRQNLVLVAYATKGTAISRTADEAFRAAPNGPVAPFPWVGNRSNTLSIQTAQYLALPFLVPQTLSTSYAGRFGFFDTNYMHGSPPFPSNSGSTYAISQCPGDFNVPVACKAQWNGQDGNYFTIVSSETPDPTNALCKLERGKTYYLNIVSGTILLPGVPTCAGTNCAASIAYFRLQ